MASLNTLRTKFGIVLSVVIALALLAFIFSLKAEMGFTGNDPKVGQIDGQKITYTEYYNLYEQMRERNGAQDNSEQQTEMLANSAWQMLIAEKVLLPGFEQMGITLTEAERLAMLSGSQYSQALHSAFADPRTGSYNVSAVHQFLEQSKGNPQAMQAWAQVNEQMRLEREMQKYMALVKGGAYANSLEIANGVSSANNTYAGRWVGKKYTDVADSLLTVSNAEIKKYYKDHKNNYKQSPSLALSYVVFEVAPTQADMTALEQTVAEVGREFATSDQIRTFIRNNRNGKIAEGYVSSSQLTSEEASALMAGKMYGPVLKNNEWTISRVVDSKNAPDSLGIKHIVLSYQQQTLADSLITAIKQGADFATLAAQHSVFESTAVNGGEVGVMPFSAFTGEFVAPLASAKKGDVVKIVSGESIQIMQVYRADAPKAFVQLATITYPVEASTETRRNIHNTAGTFAVSAKTSADSFAEAASVAAVTPRIATLSQGERSIRGVEDSREVARWAYGAKQGDVSEIFTVGKDYVVAMLTEIDDESYSPISKVSSQIRMQLLRDKKYDYIAKQISGSTIEEQAASLGSQPAEFNGVTYASFYVDGMGVEPRVVGAIASSQQNALSAPIKGLSGLYVFVVDQVATDEKQTPEAEQVRAQAMAENMAQQMSLSAVQEMAKIEDLRGKYF